MSVHASHCAHAYNSTGLVGAQWKMMTFRSLAAISVAAGLAAGARADGLPQPGLSHAEQSEQSTLRPLTTEALPVVDRVVVHKGERRLLLMHGGNIVRSYHVALGLNPTGQKERSGDFRTPEGSYRLERRNPRSDYFLSIRISYPSSADLKRAHARHWDTGGSIMIHGLPNWPKHEPEYYLSHDWTDGCIAVSNADMVEIWMLAPDDVPIDILP
jgi:murein L,D-transpeptidase YafK